MTLRLGRSVALALLLATGSGCATTRQGVGSTVATLGMASVLIAANPDVSAGHSDGSDRDARIGLLFIGAAATLVGSVIALAPSRRHPRPAPATAPATAPAAEATSAPAATVGPIAPDAPAPDAPGVRGECPPLAVCLPVTP